MLTFDEYQRKAGATSLNTLIGGDPLVYPVLGMVNEFGEVVGKLKKIYRDMGGVMTPEARQSLCSELGDVLWYLSEICTVLGADLSVVAQLNLDKLADRAERGKLQGSGDTR